MFTKELLDRAAQLSLSELVSPSGALEDGDTVLGELPEDLRRLWTVFAQMANELDKLIEELSARYPDQAAIEQIDEKTFDELHNTTETLEAKMKIAKAIFWQEAKIAFPDGSCTCKAPTLTVCEGWKLVARQSRLGAFVDGLVAELAPILRS